MSERERARTEAAARHRRSRGQSRIAAGKGGVRRISTVAGYGYLYLGTGDPMKSGAGDWIEIMVPGGQPGQLLGTREIDGLEVYVIKIGDNKRGPVAYAQTALSLK